MPLSRSEQMSRIRGKDTRPELVLRSALWRSGLRYRLGRTVLGTRPDLVFPKNRVAVFVDGCFWHGCPEHYTRPRSSSGFWAQKLRANVDRDARQTSTLESAGWRVVRVWEHDVWSNTQEVIGLVCLALTSRTWNPEADWRVLSVSPSGVGREETEQVVLARLRDLEVTRVETRERRASGGSDFRA